MTGETALRIGEVAEQTSLSLRTLRHYEEIGLVAPSARTEGGFRLYSEQDVARLMIVRRMKPLGYTLEEMRALLDVVDAIRGGAADAETVQKLDKIRDEAHARRKKLATQVAMADDFLAQLEDI
ncbi:MerR family transcriptional regulator [Microbacterium paraoxydans]|uniref:DNA-binding transcriptional regulator, MerR family n=1 Tax=Microbacterium paraoxydans TaxID=199592 RepID=A0A1H1X217_9MICO|nr:MerR family transcriptional regulator [Microbacterium paraoxydans]SDT03407.1 DNA-binding transcriptional regulator, MerR family [Microbacterium paraoxydans]